MASSTTTRRVLSDLNVNTPSSRIASQSTLEKSACSPQKSFELSEELSLHALLGGKMANTTREVSPVGKSKRGSIVDEDIQNSPKRRKTTEALHDDGVRLRRSVQGDVKGVGLADKLQRRDFLSPGGPDMESSQLSTPSGSPSSSIGDSTNDMNDTQNTIITEPDTVPFPVARPTAINTLPTQLTSDELREKATAIRLRLSLASYKVRTNQIDVPMSRLEIRSSPSSQKLPSLPRTTPNISATSHRRTALPSGAAALNFPNAHHQGSSIRQTQPPNTNIPSSPPPPYRELDRLASPAKDKEVATRYGFATPILPRQRQGLLNPPQLSSPTREDRRSAGNDLTSSVVKGRAADGLLSLMRQ